ncbi:substrate-binding and VWA domain-containing protein [Actinoallomurus rhizosphaericola]|uniref:substrate-binding and VWA domain-containing protein n=1 Tax=Actinoallomurus rhizosphaericola TaxID=2952536 RepID=UPI002093D307|nr:substrate-binding and VWA domain-containing protein [Actinoallomurus rhizosphaericola]MCO5998958.1 substrate-binding and VWA domain-containing protein [Actinoallomurus rhizosphaericola]
MSRRRRNDMPPGDMPGDGQPYRAPRDGGSPGNQAPSDDRSPFAPRRPESSGSPQDVPGDGGGPSGYGGGPAGYGTRGPGGYGSYTAPGEQDRYGTGTGSYGEPGGQDRRGTGAGPRSGAGEDRYGTGSYDSSSYIQGGGFFGRQGGGLPGPGGGSGYGTGPGYGGAGSGYGGAGSGYGSGQGAGGRDRGPGGTGSGGPGGSGYGGTGSGGSGYGGSGYGGSGRGDAGAGGSDDDRPRSSAPGTGRRRAQRRRTIGALVGPLAGAIGLAILLGAGVYALADGSKCGGTPISLKVVAAPDIAPAVSDITNSFNGERHSVDGKCVKATVKAADPAGTTTILSGQGTVPGDVTPDVWIPDSSLWVTLVRSSPKGASSVDTTPTSVAETPLVVATTKSFANKINGQGIRPTWDMLLKATDALAAGAVSKNDMLPANSVHLQILDPTRNAGGLGAVVMTRMLLQGDPHADAIFTQIARKVQNSLSPNTQALFASFHRNLHGRAPVVIAPEQAVWKYNRGRPSAPASAIYPSEGMLSLDHPYTLTTDDDTKVRAAQLLEKSMSTEQAQAAVRALGFRTPDGRAGTGFGAASGVSPRIPRALPTPGSSDVTGVMQAWTKLSLRTRMLTLLDVSGSMAQPVGKGVTRMEATAQVAQGGLAMLPDDTDLGLWTFSTNLRGNQDYRTEVPIGPLSTRLGSGTRRQAILSALGRLRPKPDGNTGLYDSVLAAFRSMKKTYKPGYYNSVLVFTDGKNDKVNGISLNALLRTLKKENDPAAPVQVIFIGYGPDVDMAAMQKIAAETDGAAYQAMKPQEIQTIFLDTVARRICTPECH